MADLEVVVTEGPSLVVQVEEEPDVFVNVAIPPPVEVVEVQVLGPAGPPGEPGPQGEPGTGGGVTDHGALTGLSDDDHLQYHTDARGDARYLQSIPSTYATDAEVASAIGTHEAAADPHTGYQKESEKGGANGYASLDGDGLVPTSQLPPGSSAPADASTTVKGISKLSSAPASSTNPIAVGDNDARIPTQGENDALAGTNGIPSSTNLFVTDSDPRNANARTPSAHEHDHIANLETDSRLMTSGISSFPMGVSVMYSEDETTTDTFAWDSGPQYVQTMRFHDDNVGVDGGVQQRFYAYSGAFQFRGWHPEDPQWTEWDNFLANTYWDDIQFNPFGDLSTAGDGDTVIFDDASGKFLPGPGGGGAPEAHAASHKGDGADPIANATTSVAGLESAADKTKLDGVETGATADQTAAEILTAIKTVDGSGSGLDADTLDGHDTAYFAISSDLAAKADLVGGVVPTSQIPALAINDVFTVASQAAMLALTAQRGDIAVRTDFDPDRTYMLSTDSPGTLADWIRVTFGDVVNVNGQTGVIVLGYADVGAASTSDTRIPTQGENDALVGTNGTPSTSNKFVTDSDSRNSNARTPTAHATTHTNGTDDIQSATASQKGLMTTAYASKVDGIEAGATADQTAAEIRAALKAATDVAAESAAITSFDEGVTLMLTTAGANWGPNTGEAGRVLTERTGSVGTQQFLTDNGKVFYRSYSGSWGSWVETNAWNDLTGKPSTFSPSTHASSHVTGGSDVIANAVAAGNAGLLSGSDKTKLDGIESGATADQTASEILTAIKTVDGPGSGLDADTLDGHDTSYFQVAGAATAKSTGTIGNGSSTSIAYTHNLGTRAVVVSVHDATTFDEVQCDVTKTDTNNVTVAFAVAPATNAYVVTVVG